MRQDESHRGGSDSPDRVREKEAVELANLLKELFATQKLGVLATHRDGQPYTNLVAFAATDDLRHLVFATTRGTRKYANIGADARVAVLVDNRSNQEADFHKATAVTATGSAEELSHAERERLVRLYLNKHPHLEEFVTAPTSAVLKVTVECYYVVRRFQHVMELRPWE